MHLSLTDVVLVADIHHLPAQGQKFNAELPRIAGRSGPWCMLARIRITVRARGIYDLVTG